jgi:hypothetical protein
MRVDKSVEAGLALIAKDKSKILHLSHRKHTNIQPGDFLPKKGQETLTSPYLNHVSGL